MSSYASVCVEGFERSRERFEAVACWLAEDTTAGLSHTDLEERLQADARELFRQLLQDHLDLRAVREQRRDEVVGEDGVARRHVPFLNRTCRARRGD